MKLSNRHAFSLREAMIYRNGQHIGIFEQNSTLEFRGVIIEDREYSIELPFSEQFDQLLAGPIGHLDRHMRVDAPEEGWQHSDWRRIAVFQFLEPSV
ncbi:MAG: hypothetical protein USCAAHI_03240 [Beijerinckiaceae bacterium]|nr:MAG: hypothetical protein USCAAHI_03240 [Beijerinckiaceae bacterium]